MDAALENGLRQVEARMAVLARAWGVDKAALARAKETQTRALSQAVVAVVRFPELRAELVDTGARLVLLSAGHRPPATGDAAPASITQRKAG
jgi:hypothetical protein